MTPAERARLRALRDAASLTYAEIGRRAGGLQPMQVFNLLVGNNDNPKVETLRRVVRALGGTMAGVFADYPEADVLDEG